MRYIVLLVLCLSIFNQSLGENYKAYANATGKNTIKELQDETGKFNGDFMKLGDPRSFSKDNNDEKNAACIAVLKTAPKNEKSCLIIDQNTKLIEIYTPK